MTHLTLKSSPTEVKVKKVNVLFQLFGRVGINFSRPLYIFCIDKTGLKSKVLFLKLKSG